jgi:hypothetical protein
MARASAHTGKGPVRKVTQKDSKYLLRIPEDLRREIRIEALTKDQDMSNYICDILRKRSR